MRVNHKLVYAGVFLVAIGGVLVAADLGEISNDSLIAAFRLWPLALIAIGMAVALRRTRIGLSTGLLGAAVPGLLFGTAFATLPRVTELCAGAPSAGPALVDEGTFEAPAVVMLNVKCGTLSVATAPGASWRFSAETDGRRPQINAAPSALSISSGGTNAQSWDVFSVGRDAFDLALPTSRIDTLHLFSDFGHISATLPGADVGQLNVRANASDVLVDATGALVERLNVSVDVGLVSIHLGSGADLTGVVRVRAGGIQLCAPPDLGMQVTTTGNASSVTVNGLQQGGHLWQSPAYDTAAHRADLTIDAQLGAVQIDPIGGCK